MYIVTWLFEGAKQSQKYASSGGAERRASELRRFGCKQVKVRPVDIHANNAGPMKINGHKAGRMSTADLWKQIEGTTMQGTGSEDLDEARKYAKELHERKVFTRSEITAKLNEKFEPEFFATKTGIYAKQEPDYLPEILIIKL